MRGLRSMLWHVRRILEALLLAKSRVTCRRTVESISGLAVGRGTCNVQKAWSLSPWTLRIHSLWAMAGPGEFAVVADGYWCATLGLNRANKTGTSLVESRC